MSTEERDPVVASETFNAVIARLSEQLGPPNTVYLAKHGYPTERWFAGWGHVEEGGGVPRCVRHQRDAIRLIVEDRRTECLVTGICAEDGHVIASPGGAGWRTLWLKIAADGSLAAGHHVWCGEKNHACACWTKEEPHWTDLSTEELFHVAQDLITRAALTLAAARRAAFWSVSPDRGRCATAQALCESRSHDGR